MTYKETKSGIEQVLSGLETIAENGGYHEKKTALNAIQEMGWFGNHDYNGEFQMRIQSLIEKLKREIESDTEMSTTATPGGNNGGGYA